MFFFFNSTQFIKHFHQIQTLNYLYNSISRNIIGRNYLVLFFYQRAVFAYIFSLLASYLLSGFSRFCFPARRQLIEPSIPRSSASYIANSRSQVPEFHPRTYRIPFCALVIPDNNNRPPARAVKARRIVLCRSLSALSRLLSFTVCMIYTPQPVTRDGFPRAQNRPWKLPFNFYPLRARE